MRNIFKSAIFIAIMAFVMGCSNLQLQPGDEWNISYGTEGNGQVAAKIMSETTGTVLKISVTPDAGWTLVKLMSNDVEIAITGTNLYTLPIPTTAIKTFKINATFSTNPISYYTVGVTQDVTKGTIAASATSAKAGDIVSLTVAAAPNFVYKAGSLTVNGVAVTGTGPTFTFTMPAANVAITAVFEAVAPTYYSITTASDQTNGTIAISPASAKAADKVTVVVTPKTGYQIASFTAAGAVFTVSGTTYTLTMPAANVAVAVTFSLITQPAKFTVKYFPTVGSDNWGNGYNARFEITNNGTVAAGDWVVTMNLNATTFSMWGGVTLTHNAGVTTMKPIAGGEFSSVAAGATIKVGFTVLNTCPEPTNVKVPSYGPSFAVTFDAQSGSAAAAISVTQGDAIGSALPSTSRNGYDFGGWYTAPAGAGTAVTSSTVVTAAFTAYAKWTISQIVNYSSSGTYETIPGFSWPAANGTTLCNNKSISPVTAQKSLIWDFIIPSWGQMLLVNNLWGIPAGNGTGTGIIFSEKVNGTDTYGYAWNMSGSSVVSYQEIGWGWSPNRAQTEAAVSEPTASVDSGFFNDATPLYKLNCGKRFYVDFDVRRTDRSGTWNTAFDIWLSKKSKPYGGTGNTSAIGAIQNGKNGPNQLYEIMIWFDHVAQYPWGDNGQNVTINGQSWTVYDNNGSAGWRVISYIKNGAGLDSVRNFDISNIMIDAANRYGGGREGYPGLTQDHYVNAVEFGSESCGGSGMFEMANYRLVIK